jgi:hypothetical protein
VGLGCFGDTVVVEGNGGFVVVVCVGCTRDCGLGFAGSTKVG